MHTDNGSVKACADFSDGKRRSVGSEDTILLADILQFLKGLFLDIHNFQSCFHNQITVCTDGLYTGSDFSEDCVSRSLLHFSFCNSLLQSLCNSVLAVSSKFFINVAQKYFVSFCLGKSLSNTGSHCTCTNNTNLHVV